MTNLTRLKLAAATALILAATAAVGAPRARAADAADERKAAAEREVNGLQGTWKFVAAETDADVPQATMKDWRWVIKEHEIEWVGPAPGGLRYAFNVNPAASPREIDLSILTGADAFRGPVRGVYRLDDKGRLVVVLRDLREAARGRPKALAYAGGEGLSFLVLDRVKAR